MDREISPSDRDPVEALAEISRALTSDMYIEDILKLIVSVTAQVTGSKICSIMLVDEKAKLIRIRASQAMSDAYLRKSPLRLGEGIAGKVVREAKPVIVRDVRRDPDYKYRDIAVSEGLVSMLAVPMSVRGRVIGVLHVYTSREHDFTAQEVAVLGAIADQAAIIIENTELIVQTKVLREEIELRKKVERAKGILMREEKLSEADAWRKMRRFSMDRRKNMKEIAEAIIMADEIIGAGERGNGK